MIIKNISIIHDVLMKIMELDNSFYSEDVTDAKWYTDRYKDCHNVAILTDDSGINIYGYAVMIPVAEAFYNAIVSGAVVGDVSMNPRMILNNSPYMYLASCVIAEPYRHQGFGTKLVISALKSYSFHWDKVCCLTVSDGGFAMMKDVMGMNFTDIGHCKYGEVCVFASNYDDLQCMRMD